VNRFVAACLPLTALFLAPAAAAAPYRGTLDLGDRTELRGGWFGLATDPGFHVENVPSLSLSLATHQSLVNLGYAPRFALSDLQLGLNPSQLQSGSAEFVWHSRDVRISLSEYASYGTLNYSALQLPSSSAPGVLRVDPVLRRIITYEGSSTSLALAYTPARRWATRLAASYTLSGAAKESDRDVLPLFYGPRFDAMVEYAALHKTSIITRGFVEKATVSTGYDYVFVQGAEGLRKSFDPVTDAELDVGIAEVRTHLPAPRSEIRYDTYGTIEGAVIHRIPYRDLFEVQVRAALGPAINRVTGLVSQQVQALVRANLKSWPWLFTFEGGFADPIHDEPGGLMVFSGQPQVSYFFSKEVELGAGTRLAWQKLAGADSPTTQKLFFVWLTLREPTMRF
jgi:hypothetical protein